jgi:hypothetical protein
MAATHNLGLNWSGGGLSLSASNSYSGTGEANIVAESVPDSTTDQQVNIALDVSAIQAIYIKSSTALMVETNSATVPDDTITLVADVPYIWHTGSYFTNLLTTDVTALFLTNASGAAATFELRCVYDSTP